MLCVCNNLPEDNHKVDFSSFTKFKKSLTTNTLIKYCRVYLANVMFCYIYLFLSVHMYVCMYFVCILTSMFQVYALLFTHFTAYAT